MKNIGIISESSLIDDKSFIFYWTLPLRTSNLYCSTTPQYILTASLSEDCILKKHTFDIVLLLYSIKLLIPNLSILYFPGTLCHKCQKGYLILSNCPEYLWKYVENLSKIFDIPLLFHRMNRILIILDLCAIQGAWSTEF